MVALVFLLVEYEMAIFIKHLYVVRDFESFRFMNIIKSYPLPIVDLIDCLHCILFVKVLE